MDKLTLQELNKFLSEFLITVHNNNDEYEPNSLRAFFASFEESASGKPKGSKMERQGQQA